MSVRRLTFAGTAVLTLLLTGCSSEGGDSAATPDTSAVASAAPRESTAPDAAESESDIAVVDGEVTPVGGTFSSIFYGEFDFEYLGLVDLGTADGGVAGDIRCFGVAANVTLTDLDETFDTGAIVVSFAQVLDAGGRDLGAVQVAGCPRTFTSAAWLDIGETTFPLDQRGVPVENVIFTTVGVPAGEIDAAVAVSLTSLLGSPAVAFEVTQTI